MIYDYYNGGNLKERIDLVSKTHYPQKDLLDYWMGAKVATKHILFMENRLEICFSLLEILEAFHNSGRLHCDLHWGNIIFHYDYEGHNVRYDVPATKIYVGLNDVVVHDPSKVHQTNVEPQ